MSDAEKLLGGYATGTLTEEERSRLFHAALRNQDLFNALADEDALRELLADPAARAKVLAALAGPAPAKVIPFYRRMPVLGAAASLLIAVTAGLAYWRTQGTEPLPRTRTPEAPAPAAIQEAPKPEAPPAATPEAPRRKQMKAPATDSLQDLGHAAPKEMEMKERVEEAPKALPPPPPAPAPMPAAAAADKAEGRTMEAVVPRKAEKKAAKTERPAYAPSGGPAAQSNAVNQYQANQANQAGLFASAQGAGAASPVWTVETLEDGRRRIRVLWTEGHLVLLRRQGANVTALRPAAPPSRNEGRQEAIFLVPKGEDALDLYVLPEAPADPTALPAEGPFAGFRRRIHSGAK